MTAAVRREWAACWCRTSTSVGTAALRSIRSSIRFPYGDCTDQSSGGYGDGFGTATTASAAPGWQVHFDQGTASYNTQDGLDALHISGPGSTMTDTRVLAFGNEGQQLKVGGATATIQNSVIVGNCEAMSTQAIPGTPAGFGTKLLDPCRAGNTAILINVTPGDPATFQDNTVYDAGAIGLEVEYATNDSGPTNTLKYNNNIFIGFFNAGSQANATPIYSNTDLKHADQSWGELDEQCDVWRKSQLGMPAAWRDQPDLQRSWAGGRDLPCVWVWGIWHRHQTEALWWELESRSRASRPTILAPLGRILRALELMNSRWCLRTLFALLLGCACLPLSATTWYVRPDGGTRYSANVAKGQCDGKGDAAYPGSGVNKHCAFKDVRYLWADGSYNYGKDFPGWGWIGAGGDTYILRGSIGTGVSYRVGWNSAGDVLRYG